MSISKKQLSVLFLCSLVTYMVGNGLLPLLPVYAESMGASALMEGLYLALAYVAIAVGALCAGKVSASRLGRKIPIIFAYLLGAPIAWLLGSVTALWELVFLTALLWFFGGLGLALSMILTGLSAGENERGKIFGVISLTIGLGAVIGGLGTGWLVKGWGFPTMFRALAILLFLGSGAALFLEEKEDQNQQPEEDQPQAPAPLGRNYSLLFWASTVVSTGGFIFIFIRSLSMSALGFDAMEISSSGVVGGLVSFPLPFLLGWLSDRFDRKKVLILGYLMAILGLLLLAGSSHLWHFWSVTFLAGITVGTNSSVGNALVADLIPGESRGKGLALFSATVWIGGIIGFALAGFMLQNLTLQLSCTIGSLLGIASIGLLIPIRAGGRLVKPRPTGSTR
jgi:MFS transporter, DHA1 family, multidrug resistance protein